MELGRVNHLIRHDYKSQFSNNHSGWCKCSFGWHETVCKITLQPCKPCFEKGGSIISPNTILQFRFAHFCLFTVSTRTVDQWALLAHSCVNAWTLAQSLIGFQYVDYLGAAQHNRKTSAQFDRNFWLHQKIRFENNSVNMWIWIHENQFFWSAISSQGMAPNKEKTQQFEQKENAGKSRTNRTLDGFSSNQ